MAETTMSPAVRAKQWDDKFFMEYVRNSRFKRYMGSDENSIIQVNNDLTKKKGDAITFNLIGALDASSGPNDGSTLLVGAEKALPNDGHKVTIRVVRDATVVNMEEEQAAPIDIRNAGKVALKDLAMRYLKTAVIDALSMIAGVKYSSATTAQKNAWNVANADRVLYGNSIANYNATHATALANVDATNDKLTKEVVSLLKRIAQGAATANGDGIRPFTYGEDEETFVLFAGKNAYRDLKADLATVHTDAMQRGKENPLFTGTTSLLWDGVVIREIPEIADVGTVGAASANVAPVYLCGAQAIGVAWAQTTKTTVRKEDDYGFRNGVGFQELRGVEKIVWDQEAGQDAVDWAVVTGFVAAAADA
jgi:hypothetical protein